MTVQPCQSVRVMRYANSSMIGLTVARLGRSVFAFATQRPRHVGYYGPLYVVHGTAVVGALGCHMLALVLQTATGIYQYHRIKRLYLAPSSLS